MGKALGEAQARAKARAEGAALALVVARATLQNMALPQLSAEGKEDAQELALAKAHIGTLRASSLLAQGREQAAKGAGGVAHGHAEEKSPRESARAPPVKVHARVVAHARAEAAVSSHLKLPPLLLPGSPKRSTSGSGTGLGAMGGLGGAGGLSGLFGMDGMGASGWPGLQSRPGNSTSGSGSGSCTSSRPGTGAGPGSRSGVSRSLSAASLALLSTTSGSGFGSGSGRLATSSSAVSALRTALVVGGPVGSACTRARQEHHLAMELLKTPEQREAAAAAAAKAALSRSAGSRPLALSWAPPTTAFAVCGPELPSRGAVFSVFQDLDVYGSGHIVYSAVEEAALLVGIKADQIAKLYEMLDTQGKGYVTVHEWGGKDAEHVVSQFARLYLHKTRGPGGRYKGTPEVDDIWAAMQFALAKLKVKCAGRSISNENVLAAFQFIDRDGSGSLDKEDVADAFDALGIYVQPKVLDSAMAVLDRDGNGSIDYHEFVKTLFPRLLQ
ncbi:hypothetical protein FOA52_010769 [Chlamydomonas sp. UWO 241]|nr:hypothetical protein FOA52_010769 [Chlamydomonas sp. UWO 241]